MVTFIGAQFGRTLSRFDGTAPGGIQPLNATPLIVAALNAYYIFKKAGEKFTLAGAFPKESCGKLGTV
jgi:hypothetical protein